MPALLGLEGNKEDSEPSLGACESSRGGDWRPECDPYLLAIVTLFICRAWIQRCTLTTLDLHVCALCGK
jgi:hypothetical protein